MDDTSSTPRASAFLPFLVFLIFYLGLSLWANDFYKVPMPLAFLVASAVAVCQNRRRKLSEKIDDYAKGMGDTNIMIMCLIFILAGAFASVAKGMGAVEAAVELTRLVIPPRLMLSGMFVISCLVSLSIGTSCGTIAAVTPIALGLTESLGISPAWMIGAVVGGSMFGDNLSMISDTTIAATRTQGIEMRQKFLANVRIAIPSAIAATVLYVLIGSNPAISSALPSVTWNHLWQILPYVLIFVLAIVGMNVMMLLFCGTVMAAAIGILIGKLDFWSALKFIGDGSLGMAETLFVALLAGGLLRLIRQNGGIRWLLMRIERTVSSARGREFGILLLICAINLFTANNTVAIVIAGPIAKELAERFNCVPSRVASILDSGSCVIQGLIPYGAQILIAAGLAKSADVQLSSIDLICHLHYPLLLLLALLVSICFAYRAAKPPS